MNDVYTSAEGRRASVLLVEDNPQVLLALRQALLPAGYECQGCHDPDVALEAILAQSPELVIIDVLFGEQGRRLHEQIQSDPRLRGVAVMLLSGGQTPDVVRHRGPHGAAYCLRKPFDARLLLQLVDKVLWMPHLSSSPKSQPVLAGGV